MRTSGAFLVMTTCLAGCGGEGDSPTDVAGGLAGGDGGVVSNVTCVAGGPRQTHLDPGVRGQVTGTNGTFTDECDPSGNLIGYSCEFRLQCAGGPDCFPYTVETGVVESRHYDCDGRCVNGACEASCPEQGDILVYLDIDGSGNVTFRNEADNRRYVCTPDSRPVHRSVPPGDCGNAKAGQRTIVVGLGLRSSFCTGSRVGNIATAEPGVTSGAGPVDAGLGPVDAGLDPVDAGTGGAQPRCRYRDCMIVP
ncbi:MAG: hypothetical protein MJD61_12510 [Proteobacteria bacterium]|nr:hypothetical protein [Pseudomonadota bacterium]